MINYVASHLGLRNIRWQRNSGIQYTVWCRFGLVPNSGPRSIFEENDSAPWQSFMTTQLDQQISTISVHIFSLPGYLSNSTEVILPSDALFSAPVPSLGLLGISILQWLQLTSHPQCDKGPVPPPVDGTWACPWRQSWAIKHQRSPKWWMKLRAKLDPSM